KMTSQKKENIIQSVLSSSREGKAASAFLQDFYAQVPVEDLAGWEAADLSAGAKIMYDWGRERKAGQHKVRVFNPDQKRDGYAAPHTSIAIVNDDMRFIIDTVTSELGYQGYIVEALFHPILAVGRDKGVMK